MKTTHQFTIGDFVCTPVSVFESGTAKIVGREWGPDLRNRSPGWVYLLAENGQGTPWQATEDEVVKWQAGEKAA